MFTMETELTALLPSRARPAWCILTLWVVGACVMAKPAGFFHQVPENEPFWAKCITRGKDKVMLTCPSGHVIYRPVFLAGARADGQQTQKCEVRDDDCVGQVHDMEAQVTKCYWRRSCKLTWKKLTPIVTSLNDSCVGRVPSYVIMTNAPCISPHDIITMCDGEEIVTSSFGVIRSHESYPSPSDKRPMAQQLHKKILEPDKSHTLILRVDDVNLSSCDFFKITHLTSTEEVILMDKRQNNQRDIVFAVTSGQIVISYIMGGRDCVTDGRGFLIRFEQRPFQHKSTDLAQGDTANVLAAFGETNFNVKAAISRCVGNSKQEITLRCPESHVIFQPEVIVGVAGWERRCHGEYGDCQGLTPALVVQRHQCHWHQTCSLSWQRGAPILKADDYRCLARKPDYVQFEDASCLPKDSIVDICDRDFWHINGTQLYLRSHGAFPWNYNRDPTICRKRIRVHRKYGLHITSHNLDLNPNGKRDNLKLWKVSENNGRRMAKVFHENEIVDERFDSGCVDVEFRRTRSTNGGAGFVLKLDTLLPANEMTDDFTDCGSLAEAIKQHRAARLARKRRRLIRSKGVR